jgi:hypothetical protein
VQFSLQWRVFWRYRELIPDLFVSVFATGSATSAGVRSRVNITWYNVYPGGYPPLAEVRVAQTSLYQAQHSLANLHLSMFQIPWYVVAGNHDWLGNVTALLDIGRFEPLWNMPNLFYTFTVSLPSSADTLQFIMVDTETLTGGDAGQFDSAPPGVFQPPINELQWEWLNNTLQSSTADWIVVVGHFPVLSVGENGPTPLLVERLLPMLQQAGVALYLCGHDHQLSHISPTNSDTGTDFVVSGAGAKYNISTEHADDLPTGYSLKFQYGVGCGFATIKVTRPAFRAPSAMTVQLWDGTGSMLYSFTKSNPRAKYLPPGPPAPPRPPSPFDTKSNKTAIMVGLVGMFAGLGAICGGVGRVPRAGGGEGGSPMAEVGGSAAGLKASGGAGGVRAAAPPAARGAGRDMERGETSSLLAQPQRRPAGYGIVSSAKGVTNRL